MPGMQSRFQKQIKTHFWKVAKSLDYMTQPVPNLHLSIPQANNVGHL